MRQRTRGWLLAVLGALVVGLSVWVIVAAVRYLQSPPGAGGAWLGPDGRLVIGPKPVSPSLVLIPSALWLGVLISFVVVFFQGKRRGRQHDPGWNQ